MPPRPIQLDSIAIERAAPLSLKCLASILHSPACSLKGAKGYPSLCVAYTGEGQPVLTEKVTIRGTVVGVRRGPKLVEMSVDDGSGELLSCILWESSAEAWRQLPDDATELLCRVVAVKGQLRTFRNNLQIRITALDGIFDFSPDQEAQWWLDVVEEWDLVQTRIFEQCICPRPAEVIQLGPVSCQRYTLCPCRRLPPAFASAVAGYRTAIRALIDLRRRKDTVPSPSEIRDLRRVFETSYTKFGVKFDSGASVRLPGQCVSKCVAQMAIGELVKSGELARDEEESVRHWVATADTQSQKLPFSEVVSELGCVWEKLDSGWFLGFLHAVCEGEPQKRCVVKAAKLASERGASGLINVEVPRQDLAVCHSCLVDEDGGCPAITRFAEGPNQSTEDKDAVTGTTRGANGVGLYKAAEKRILNFTQGESRRRSVAAVLVLWSLWSTYFVLSSWMERSSQSDSVHDLQELTKEYHSMVGKLTGRKSELKWEKERLEEMNFVSVYGASSEPGRRLSYSSWAWDGRTKKTAKIREEIEGVESKTRAAEKELRA
ncbi:hypothetical protein FOZ62_011673, partial [Perkinsus olseni]